MKPVSHKILFPSAAACVGGERELEGGGMGRRAETAADKREGRNKKDVRSYKEESKGRKMCH